MLKVLLVDDEPFIMQGLKVIIDWENEGFEIAGTVSNGKEALQFLENENVDLVIADIRMPEMTGLELLETLRKDKKSDVYFVILSGYADFSYAQQAMQNDCTDYILKPVDKEMLLKVLNKVLVLKNEKNQIDEDNKKMKQAYLARHLISLIQGKYDEVNLNYVKENMRCEGGARYVEIQMEQLPAGDEILDSDMRSLQRKMYESCVAFLGADSAHCVFDVSVNEKVYDIGFIFSDYMAEEAAKTERKYLEDLRRYICDNTQKNIVMLVGRKVSDISKIARSYGNACMLRSFQGFRIVKSIYYYEDEVKISADGIVLCKDSLKAALTYESQNLLLIYIIILLTCQVYELKQQIINIQVHRLPANTAFTHFFIKESHRLPDFQMIVLFDCLQQAIQALLTQDQSFRRYLDLLLIEIDILLCPKPLKRTKHTGIAVRLCYAADILHFFSCQHHHICL